VDGIESADFLSGEQVEPMPVGLVIDQNLTLPVLSVDYGKALA